MLFDEYSYIFNVGSDGRTVDGYIGLIGPECKSCVGKYTVNNPLRT